MDMRKALPLCDFFILATGTSKRQMQSIADRAGDVLRGASMRRLGLEGYNQGRWILVDCGSIILHLFDAESRAYYDLELLWGDTPRVPWEREQGIPGDA